MFPFRGWKPYMGTPAVSPAGSPWPRGQDVDEQLRKEGWTTGYVTDNPHILSPVHERFRGQVRPRRAGRRPGAAAQAAEARGLAAELDQYLPPVLRGTSAEPRMAAYLAVNPRGRDEEDHLAARVFREGDGLARLGAHGPQPFALVVDSFDAHEPWDAPRR